MSADIGPGDVVEAVTNYPDHGLRYGDRKIVARIAPWTGTCTTLRCGQTTGFSLVGVGLAPGECFCPCGWRKIGPGREETVRRFAEDLNVQAPAKSDPVFVWPDLA